MIKKFIFGIITKLGYRLESLEHRTVFGTIDYYGHWTSRRLGAAISSDGSPTPWFTYPAIEYLDQFNLKGLRVFEYGAGHSTLWFSAKGAKVTSVETDKEWIGKLSSRVEDSATLVHSSTEDFAEQIRNYGEFELILVDAQRRSDCIKQSISHLSEHGIMIVDNSERHPKECEWLRAQGLLQVDFKGFGSVNRYTWCTSFFFKSNTTPFIAKTHQPTMSIGGEQTL